MQKSSPHQSLKEKQRQERAELILQVAVEVLAEKGYHETSMDDISARVGVAKGTLYLHFPSKDDLIFALFERELEHLHQAIEEKLNSDLSARGKLESILQEACYGLLGKRMQLLGSLYTSMNIEKDLLEKKLQLHERAGQISTCVTQVLEEGKATGELDPTIPTSMMLIAFLNLLTHGEGVINLLSRENLTTEEVATYLGRIYFSGIATKK